jgi:hypothetical protein
MPALPWTRFQPIDPARRYLAMASHLPLRAHRGIPGFLRDTMRIRRQLAQAPGLVGYALDAELARKTFWTISVWVDEPSLSVFAAGDPHRQLTRRLQPLMAESRFEFFPIRGRDLPLSWGEVRRRLSAGQPARRSRALTHGGPGYPGTP